MFNPAQFPQQLHVHRPRTADSIVREQFSDSDDDVPIERSIHPFSEQARFNDVEQWDMLLDILVMTAPPENRVGMVKTLLRIAKKLKLNEDKYRVMYTSNAQLHRKLLQFDGGLEFLLNLGFRFHAVEPDKLECPDIDNNVLHACIVCLEDKLDALTPDDSQSGRELSPVPPDMLRARTAPASIDSDDRFEEQGFDYMIPTATGSTPGERDDRKDPDPRHRLRTLSTGPIRKRTIVFMRHGNSMWNLQKGKGKMSAMRAVISGYAEYYRMQNDVGGHSQSQIVDAPLSTVGIEEAYHLSQFLNKHLIVRQKTIFKMREHNQQLERPLNEAMMLLQNALVNAQASSDRSRDFVMLRDSVSQTLSKLQEVRHKITPAALGVHGARENDGDLPGRVSGRGAITSKINRAYSHIVDDDANDLSVGAAEFKQNSVVSENVLDDMIEGGPGTIIVCSNLRRAISTGVIALWDRFSINVDEKMIVLPCLQEIGMNFDTHTPILNGDALQVSQAELDSPLVHGDKLAQFYLNRLEWIQSAAQKNGLRENESDFKGRLRQFADWVFQQPRMRTVVAVGHSHWFRAFFKEFLPRRSKHPARKRKLQNVACVAFQFCQYNTGDRENCVYEIQEESITNIYRGLS